MVAWIRDNSNPGALGPAWVNVCYFPRARAPVEPDAAWLPRFMIAVIMEPWLRHREMSVTSRGLAHLRDRMRHGFLDS